MLIGCPFPALPSFLPPYADIPSTALELIASPSHELQSWKSAQCAKEFIGRYHYAIIRLDAIREFSNGEFFAHALPDERF